MPALLHGAARTAADEDLGSVSVTSVSSYLWRHFKFQTDYTQYQDFALFGSPYPLAPDDYGVS